jgi:hypothetical protein
MGILVNGPFFHWNNHVEWEFISYFVDNISQMLHGAGIFSYETGPFWW